MANYSFKDLVIEFDNDAGALQNISQYVLDIDGVEIEGKFEEGHAAGEAWVKQLFVGIKEMKEVTIGGFYNDAASPAPDKLFFDGGTAIGATRTLAVTYGGTKKTTAEMGIKSYKRGLARDKLHRYEVKLLLCGTVTEA